MSQLSEVIYVLRILSSSALFIVVTGWIIAVSIVPLSTVLFSVEILLYSNVAPNVILVYVSFSIVLNCLLKL